MACMPSRRRTIQRHDEWAVAPMERTAAGMAGTTHTLDLVAQAHTFEVSVLVRLAAMVWAPQEVVGVGSDGWHTLNEHLLVQMHHPLLLCLR